MVAINTSVQSKLISMKGNGSKSLYLLISLFNDYDELTNTEFKSYFLMINNRYAGGTNIPTDELMDNMANKYKSTVQSNWYTNQSAREKGNFCTASQVEFSYIKREE